MRVLRLLGTGIVALAMVSCASQKNKVSPPAPAASSERVMEIRQAYQLHNPNAQVGVVAAVDRDAHLAAVGDVVLDKLHENDVMTFIDSAQRPVANGVVIRKTFNYAHVRYESLPTDGRDPVEGDLAVKF
jgi:hypothetical protein